MSLIQANHLTKHFTRGQEIVRAVDNVSLSIEKGDSLAILGASGSGKTTLINLIGCLDNPTSGTLTINGQSVFDGTHTLAETALTKIRRAHFGYIFQKFFLIPTLTVQENILLPFLFTHASPETMQHLHKITAWLGLEKRLDHLPAQLSGGEVQRTAIARALITRPSILIADEPTGNLDSRRTEEIGTLLARLNKEQQITMILVTHNPAFAQFANCTAEMKDGKLTF